MKASSAEKGPLPAAALERLLESRQKFLAFLEKRVESRAAAEDILQAAYLRSLESNNAPEEEESVITWFYRILRNAVIDHYRRRDTSSRSVQSLLHELETHQEPTDVFRNNICQCVLGLLADLKPEYREALETVDIKEASLAELAARAEIQANNAAVRVHRAREALRKSVASACGVCATHGCLDCRCQKKTHSKP